MHELAITQSVVDAVTERTGSAQVVSVSAEKAMAGLELMGRPRDVGERDGP